LNDALAVAIRLAKAGYAGGDPEKVLEMPVGTVVGIIHYEKFRDDYERAYLALNRKEGS
jgi:hypothetical protein